MDIVRIGLLGLGHVGGAVAEALPRHADLIARRTGRTPVLSRIAVRHPDKPRTVRVHPALLTGDASAVAVDPEIDIVIEAIGGVEPAGTFVEAALGSGKQVVTANKQLISARGGALAALATRCGTALAFEASVGGALPLVRLMRDALAGDRVLAFTAVLNGTSTFILHRVEAGADFPEALAEAQALGLTEPDPEDDTSGRDAAAKCAILASLAFETRVFAHQIPHTGLRALSEADVRQAASSGRAVRLVAAARIALGRIEAGVFPAALPASHPLAGLARAENGMLVRCALAGELFIRGTGAGGVPTSSAVLSDLVSVIGGRRHDGVSRSTVLPLAPEALPELATAAPLELPV